jgi:hypothetical protein
METTVTPETVMVPQAAADLIAAGRAELEAIERARVAAELLQRAREWDVLTQFLEPAQQVVRKLVPEDLHDWIDWNVASYKGKNPKMIGTYQCHLLLPGCDRVTLALESPEWTLHQGYRVNSPSKEQLVLDTLAQALAVARERWLEDRGPQEIPF